MPIRLLMYMTQVWREELKNTDKNVRKSKGFRLPAIVPIVLYNGKNNWTTVRNFKEILNNYELFEDNVVDFKYLLFDINRMDKDKLVEIADLVSVIFLLDQDIEIEEIINRLRFIGKLLSKKATKDQIRIFRNWLINIFKNRFDNDVMEHIKSVLVETSELEVKDMVSNLGRKLEEEFNNREKKGKAKILFSLLEKKLGRIPEKYIKRLNNLSDKVIEEISLDIFDIENFEDLEKYL